LAPSNYDAYVTRLATTGNELVFSTYIGGDHVDQVSDIALDNEDNVIISGGTWSSDFPIVNGEDSPETDVSDGIVLKMDPSGQLLYSLRSNVPGDDFFEGIAIEDTFIYTVGGWLDSIRIYEITTDNSLEIDFKFAASGHNINAIHLSEGYLAFANTFWNDALKSAKISKSTSTPYSIHNVTENTSQIGGARAKVHTFDGHLFNADVINKELSVEMKLPGIMKLAWDENGFLVVTTEGPVGVEITVTTDINASEANLVLVFGTDGADVIDCLGITKDPFLDENPVIEIYGLEGNNVMYGSNTVRNVFSGGDSNDEMVGGKNTTNSFNGRKGTNISKGSKADDAYYILKKLFPPEPKETLNINKTSKKGVFVLDQDSETIRDGGGMDTLYFSEFESGITLDLTQLYQVQTIDTSGTQLTIEGNIEVVVGSQFNDTIAISPFPDTVRYIDGKEGLDILVFKSDIEGIIDDGTTISTPGFADVVYTNIETVSIPNVTGINRFNVDVKSGFKVEKTYPNPFTYETFIQYHLLDEAHVRVSVFDISGQLIRTLTDQRQSSGKHTVIWDGESDNGRKMNNGTYIFQIESAGERASGKITLSR